MIVPVILAGGSGTRLWPLSRNLHPKQFLNLVDDQTLLQNTLARLDGLAGMAAPIVLCNDAHRFIVSEQCRVMGKTPAAIVLEPVGRNTAPAVAVAALHARAEGKDPLLLVLPADHVIRDVDRYHRILAAGANLAEQGHLITFGIVPQTPETGYGYIEKGKPLALPARGMAGPTPQGVTEAVAIGRFVEKPDLVTAEGYLASGRYCWNSGMFLFRASAMIAELSRHAPEILGACRLALDKGRADLDFFRLDADAFGACPSDSIDYAIMEKTDTGAMLTFDAGWDDLGSWEALWQVGEKNEENNILRGDVLVHDVSNSYLRSSSRLLAAVGLTDCIVVETADAVLVSPRDRAQDVKHLVEALKAQDRDEVRVHRKIYRPWGEMDNLVIDPAFRLRRIIIHPGGRMSLQKHFNRAEHWVVVKGTALVTRDGEQFVLKTNESTYISPGTAHRLENPGQIPVEIVEVQSGSFLDETDVVRLNGDTGH
ncbi:MAG: mannose-1-phosphate guanylyltransferase/mannose-6-phosphate isomerase [Desulfobacterales bacterium]|nr:mannose-1-phosphate guanylyltransferase/mannose-6-phosphate isomerase [Desulfobacterales bacterium]